MKIRSEAVVKTQGRYSEIEIERGEKFERKYYGSFKRCVLSLNLNTLREGDSIFFRESVP